MKVRLAPSVGSKCKPELLPTGSSNPLSRSTYKRIVLSESNRETRPIKYVITVAGYACLLLFNIVASTSIFPVNI